MLHSTLALIYYFYYLHFLRWILGTWALQCYIVANFFSLGWTHLSNNHFYWGWMTIGVVFLPFLTNSLFWILGKVARLLKKPIKYLEKNCDPNNCCKWKCCKTLALCLACCPILFGYFVKDLGLSVRLSEVIVKLPIIQSVR